MAAVPLVGAVQNIAAPPQQAARQPLRWSMTYTTLSELFSTVEPAKQFALYKRFKQAVRDGGKTRSQNFTPLGTWLTIVPVEGIIFREEKTLCLSAFLLVPNKPSFIWDRVRASPRGCRLSVGVF